MCLEKKNILDKMYDFYLTLYIVFICIAIICSVSVDAAPTRIKGSFRCCNVQWFCVVLQRDDAMASLSLQLLRVRVVCILLCTVHSNTLYCLMWYCILGGYYMY